ncbi:MAG: efflux RND transporter periplasmic adaptor subunit [Holophagales bacterium]|nr:efflux RND transporter periplasmic adaptor subunit [Holophagales bacterium]
MAEAAYRSTQAQVQEVSQKLALLTNGPRKEQIAEERERVRQVEAANDVARNRLGYATIASPLTGMVLTDHIEPGERVAPGTPIVTVADLSNVWLRGFIDEADLGRVKLGQHVRIETDGSAGTVYAGRVSFIAQEAEFTPKSVQTARERVKLVYRLKVDIENPRHELKPGMPADAWVELSGA